MQLVRVNSRSLMNFSVGILQTLVKLVWVEILELMTCSATATGMLVKRGLTSNETKKEFQTIEIKPPVPSETTTSPQIIQKQNLKILQ